MKFYFASFRGQFSNKVTRKFYQEIRLIKSFNVLSSFELLFLELNYLKDILNSRHSQLEPQSTQKVFGQSALFNVLIIKFSPFLDERNAQATRFSLSINISTLFG